MGGYRAWLASAIVVAVLGGCGGGNDPAAPVAEAESAPAPASDPTASWPVKPLLGTWTGMMKADPSSCFDASVPDRPQTVTITSTDGHSFSAVVTAQIDGIGSLETHSEWTGEPTFSINPPSMTVYLRWDFKVVAPGRAEVTYVHNRNYTQAACMTDKWSGVMTLN